MEGNGDDLFKELSHYFYNDKFLSDAIRRPIFYLKCCFGRWTLSDSSSKTIYSLRPNL